MILNSIYQLATEAVKDKLRDEGIVMSLPAPSGELWDRDPAVCAVRERSTQGQCGEHHDFEEILDVYFVDDGCHMIAHKQAAELVKRMCLLVATIVSIFSRFQLSVNMAKGKTEVMLALWGKDATAERERSCVALMACGWILSMMRDRCIARCMLSRSTNTWGHGCVYVRNV